MKKIKMICGILAFVLFSASNLKATGFELIELHGDWDVFADSPTNPTVCYIGSKPTKDEGNYTRRGEIYVLITRYKSEGFKDVVSFHQGYPLKPGQDVRVTIGGSNFNLFPSDEAAWAYEGKDDVALVNGMRAGSNMIVNGVSSRGTKTKDTYSLSGISAAHNAMRRLCS